MAMTIDLIKLLGIATLAFTVNAAAFAATDPAKPAQPQRAAKAVPATADALFEALPDMLPTYAAAKLQKILDAFNARQNRLFKVSEDRLTIPAGRSQITFSEAGNYIIFDQTLVEEPHVSSYELGSEGADTHQSIFFSKQPMQELARLDGPTYSFANPELQLSVPAKTGCMGLETTGIITVQNIQDNTEYFTGTLPSDIIYFNAEDQPDTPNVFTFTTTDQVAVDIDETDEANADKLCDGYGWTRKTETTFELRCDPTKRQCTMKTIAESSSEGCRDIGSCE